MHVRRVGRGCKLALDVVWHAGDTRPRVFVAAGLAGPFALTAVAWLLALDRAGIIASNLTILMVNPSLAHFIFS